VVAGSATRRVRIDSLATFVPPRLLTNADLERMIETTDEWILQRTGIRERHVVDAGVATSDLAAEAAREAIAKAGLRPDQIDLIIVGTTTPDTIFPSTACLVQHKIGATKAWGFDLGAACSGFTYSLATAAQFIASGVHQHALVIGADVMSSIIDYTDRTTCVLFGDGAGAVVLGPADGDPGAGGIIDFRRRDRRLGRAGAVHAGRRQSQTGLARDRRPTPPLRAPGRADGLQVRRPQDGGDLPRLLERNGLVPGDIDLLVSHQANRRSSSSPPRSSASTRPESSSTSSASATRPRRPFPWRWPMPCGTAACDRATA
jgi:3-oxoacyl-[acyl-carrier-protein] synthase-3